MLEAGFSSAVAIGQLLRSGDRSTLDRVVAQATRDVRPDLLFALAEVVEGLPCGKALLDARLEIMGRTSRGGERTTNEALSAWWAEHRDRLAWDEGERRYRPRP